MSFLCPAFSDNHLEAGRLIVGDPSVAASLGLRFTTPAQDEGQAENGIRPARNATLARASEHSVVGGLRDSLDSSSVLGLPAVAAKREGWVAVLVDRFFLFPVDDSGDPAEREWTIRTLLTRNPVSACPPM